MPRRQNRPRHRLAALLVAAALGLTGCGQISDQLSGAVVDAGPEGTAETEGAPVLRTVAWAELDGMVSVLVENTTDRTLRYADAQITVRNARGRTLATTDRTTIGGPCCTAMDVPPGSTYGLYLYAGDDAAGAAEVEVDYRNLSWAADGGDGGSIARARPVGLRATPRGTEALVDVATSGAPIEQAVVQAVVEDAAGEFLTVISGRWECLSPGPAQRLEMQLYQRLPADSAIADVAVFPTDDAGDANAASSCAGRPTAE